MTRLAVGEHRSGIEIRARAHWNATGIRVARGERYRIRVDGTWSDGGVRCDADGFATAQAPVVSRWLLRRFESRRRMPTQRWFQLIGSLQQRDAVAFPLGRHDEWTAGGAGELHCFANDVRFAYWNNCGAVTLTIERVG